LTVADYVAKGGRPEAIEEAFRHAAERGTAWIRPHTVDEAEAVLTQKL
jgi:hypothetical protein